MTANVREHGIIKGFDLYNLGEYEKAIECFSVLQLIPDRVNACINKRLALRKLGRYQQAIRCFNKAKAINIK